MHTLGALVVATISPYCDTAVQFMQMLYILRILLFLEVLAMPVNIEFPLASNPAFPAMLIPEAINSGRLLAMPSYTW